MQGRPPAGHLSPAADRSSAGFFADVLRAHRGFEITAACQKDPTSPQQLVKVHGHAGVKLHRETRQLWSDPDRLTSNMSHVVVHKPSEGAVRRV